ncbi:MAG TPA: methyltransferase domain-containing protein [Solirubrobacterales bacterium]|jgi:predicted nicotinamide N-methyase
MELVRQQVDLPGGPLVVMQPAEAAELPDDREVDWAPLLPYWSVLWRSGVALAREVAVAELRGKRVIELGCGLGVPSLAAARGGAEALASDEDPDAIALLERNARENGVGLAAVRADWGDPGPLLDEAPFDLALAADVLYMRAAVAQLLELLPLLAPEVWLADPGRNFTEPFMERARELWRIDTVQRGVVRIHRMRERA